ncbi:acyl-CoA thioesterase [Halovulum sp. GXIMD14793]
MNFRFSQKVLFKHCDPAGIVFYPRYFEMINDAIEVMFSDLLNWPFEDIHQNGAVPTAAFDVNFDAPSRHGELLDLDLTLLVIGGSSLTLRTEARCKAELRFIAGQTLVYVNSDGRPQKWPESIREKINKLIEGNT